MQAIYFCIAIYLNNTWGWNYGFVSLVGIDMMNDEDRLLPGIGFSPATSQIVYLRISFLIHCYYFQNLLLFEYLFCADKDNIDRGGRVLGSRKLRQVLEHLKREIKQIYTSAGSHRKSYSLRKPILLWKTGRK
jgi:hypothetical protein